MTERAQDRGLEAMLVDHRPDVDGAQSSGICSLREVHESLPPNELIIVQQKGTDLFGRYHRPRV
jgi:hypothetical protein